MKVSTIKEELGSLAYHGRGIIIGKSADGKSAVTAYFIMGRSENSRNRVFVPEGEDMRTKAFDESKMTDPHLIIYYPVRVLGNKTIVTNGDQTDTLYELMDIAKFISPPSRRIMPEIRGVKFGLSSSNSRVRSACSKVICLSISS